MTDRPIIFSAPMIRAILDGRKSQTRRIIKLSAKYQCGDRLWVRENGIQLGNAIDKGYGPDGYEICGFRYAADNSTIYLAGMFEGHDYERRRNSIYMPRWASRLTLTVTDVRIQRLHDISEKDAKAEGVESREGYWGTWNNDGTMKCGGSPFAREAFRCLWVNIHGTDAWDKNPWVAAITFTAEQRNIDDGE